MTVTDAHLIVDTSYVIHFMAYRTLKKHMTDSGLAYTEEELWKIDFSRDEDYIRQFIKNFVSHVSNVCSTHLISPNNVIYALDCKRDDIWRNNHLSEYKSSRKVKKQEGLNRGPLFRYTQEKILPTLEEKNRGKALSFTAAEGDDIIALSVRFLREKYGSTHKIVVLTNDSDFLQLRDDNLKLINIMDEDLSVRSLGDPKKDLMFKILLGDTSDDIPSVFVKTKGDKQLGRGFGEKTARIFLEDSNLLREKFKQYPDAVSRFKNNKTLIDFSMIPEEIVSGVKKTMQEKMIL
jgi:5'-3' exonuclease